MAQSLMGNYEEIHQAAVLVDPSRYNHHKVQNGDWSRQDKSDDKPKWLPKRDQENGQRLEAVENFKYLGSIISNEGT